MEIIITLAINLVGFILIYLYFNQKAKNHWDDQKYLEEIRREVESLVKELNITTNRNIDLIEAKIVEIRGTLEQAEKGRKVLDTEVEKHRKSEEVYLQLGRNKLQQGNLFTGQDGSQKPEPAAEEPAEEPKAIKIDPQALKERVYELHQKGISPGLIAKNLGLSIGEVEFMIGIFRR